MTYCLFFCRWNLVHDLLSLLESNKLVRMDDDVDKQLEAEFNQWKEETAEKERLLTENKLSDKEVNVYVYHIGLLGEG